MANEYFQHVDDIDSKVLTAAYREEYREAAYVSHAHHAACRKICAKTVQVIKNIAGAIMLGSTFYAGGNMMFAGSGFAEAVVGLCASICTASLAYPVMGVSGINNMILSHKAEKKLKADLASGALKDRYILEKLPAVMLDTTSALQDDHFLTQKFPALRGPAKVVTKAAKAARDLFIEPS